MIFNKIQLADLKMYFQFILIGNFNYYRLDSLIDPINKRIKISDLLKGEKLFTLIQITLFCFDKI